MDVKNVEKAINAFFPAEIKVKGNKLLKYSLRILNNFKLYDSTIAKKDFIIAEYIGEKFNLMDIMSISNNIYNIEMKPVIIYFDRLITQNKKALVKAGISYMIGDKQFYIKEIAFLNNDYQDKAKINHNRLSAFAQSFLFELISFKEEVLYQKNLADKMELNKVYISRALKELDELNIIKRENHAKRYYINIENREEIWNKAKPYLRKPFKNKVYISERTFYENKDLFMLSGLSGLGNYTFVTSNEVSYAISRNSFSHLFKGEYYDYKFPESFEVELWVSFLPKYKDRLHPLALYACLMDSQDERVQKDLNRIEERFFSWR